MTTYYLEKGRSYGKRVAPGIHRQECIADALVALSTAMIDNVNDEVGLFYLPKGAVITGITASATDMDTNASPTLAFDIGDDGDEDRLMAATTVGQAATLSSALAVTGHLYKYTTATLIKAYVQAVSATGAAGTLRVTVRYFVDEDFSTTAETPTS